MAPLRAKITAYLQAAFPELRESIAEFHGLESVREGEAPLKAGGILVCAIDAVEGPEEHDPWPLELNYAAVIAVQAASAVERDIEGWKLALKVGVFIWRNCWGYAREIQVTPAVIKGMRKNVQRDAEGRLTGVAYWTIEFSNLTTTEVALGLE